MSTVHKYYIIFYITLDYIIYRPSKKPINHKKQPKTQNAIISYFYLFFNGNIFKRSETLQIHLNLNVVTINKQKNIFEKIKNDQK